MQSSGFQIQAVGMPADRWSLLFYGIQKTATPFHVGSSSWTCIVPPRQRMAMQFSGGGGTYHCGGFVSQDWNAWKFAHPGALTDTGGVVRTSPADPSRRSLRERDALASVHLRAAAHAQGVS